MEERADDEEDHAASALWRIQQQLAEVRWVTRDGPCIHSRLLGFCVHETIHAMCGDPSLRAPR